MPAMAEATCALVALDMLVEEVACTTIGNVVVAAAAGAGAATAGAGTATARAGAGMPVAQNTHCQSPAWHDNTH